MQHPDPAVDAAFRSALGKLDGQLLIGVINSIGNRRDVAAVDELAELLNATDQAVSAAAASSLGRIGTPGAADVLAKALTSDRAAVRAAVGDACVTCAELLLNDGNNDKAIDHLEAMYDMNYRAYWRTFIYNDPVMLHLREEPDFQALIARFEKDMERQREIAYETLGVER